MRIIFLIFLQFGIYLKAQVPKFDWIIAEGHKSDIGSLQLTTDVNSNTIANINFLLSLIGLCDEEINLNSERTDIQFLVKYDSNGQCIWKHQFSDNFTGVLDDGIFLSTDYLGNIIICSSYRGTIWLDPEQSIHAPSGIGKAFVAKLDPNGKLIWHRILSSENGIGSVSAYRVTNDNDGNVYLSASHSSGNLILDSIIIEYPILAGSLKNTLIKLDQDGNLLWFKKIESYESVFQNIGVNSLLQVVLVGSFRGKELRVDQFALTNRDTLTPNLTSDAVLLVLNRDGNVQYIKSIGGIETDYIEQLSIDDQGNIFIGGSSRSKEIEIFSKKIKSLPTSQDAINFLAKINLNYELEWLYEDHVLGMFGLNYILLNQKQDLWTAWQLNRDTIYLKGIPFVSPGNSSPDLLFIRFKNNGNIEQVFQLQGKGRENAGGYECGGLHSDGSLVISGTFTSDTLYFGDYALPTVARKQIGDQYTSAAFIARISPDGMVATKDYKSNNQSLVSILPNPSNDYIQIQLNSEITGEGELQIMNVEGRIMRDIHVKLGISSVQVDVIDWPAGVYLCRYMGHGGVRDFSKFVVE